MVKIDSRRSVKRTYTLSAETTDRFESLVPAGQRSQLVENLLQRELDEMKRQRLRAEIEEGLAHMADVNSEISKAWARTESETWPEA